MRLVNYAVKMLSRSDRFVLYPIGDVHIGKTNCAETALRGRLREILSESKEKGKVVRIVLGGDIVNAVTPRDAKRWDVNELPAWLLAGDADDIKSRLNNVAAAEVSRACELLAPVKHLIIGAIEGNHESALKLSQNIDVQSAICKELGVQNLTDEAMIRLSFQLDVSVRCVFLYIQHGHMGGRTEGSEPNNLARVRNEWESADIVLRGHSHTFDIRPPKPVLFIPAKGQIPSELRCRHRYAGNWGCFLYSHSSGPGTYESRKSYPARPMLSLKVDIVPFYHTGRRHDGEKDDISWPRIAMNQYNIE